MYFKIAPTKLGLGGSMGKNVCSPTLGAQVGSSIPRPALHAKLKYMHYFCPNFAEFCPSGLAPVGACFGPKMHQAWGIGPALGIQGCGSDPCTPTQLAKPQMGVGFKVQLCTLSHKGMGLPTGLAAGTPVLFTYPPGA